MTSLTNSTSEVWTLILKLPPRRTVNCKLSLRPQVEYLQLSVQAQHAGAVFTFIEFIEACVDFKMWSFFVLMLALLPSFEFSRESLFDTGGLSHTAHPSCAKSDIKWNNGSLTYKEQFNYVASSYFAIVLLRRIVKHLFRRGSVTFRQSSLSPSHNLLNIMLGWVNRARWKRDKNRVNKNARSNISQLGRLLATELRII